MPKIPFNPKSIGFFQRLDYQYPPGVEHYELDHPDINKTIEKDWRRYNVFMSKDNEYVRIWTGTIDLYLASELYEEIEGFELEPEQHHELFIQGYIKNNEAGKLIWESLRLSNYLPQYLGEAGPYLDHYPERKAAHLERQRIAREKSGPIDYGDCISIDELEEYIDKKFRD